MAETYAVWRQDQDGNVFVVSEGWASREEAQEHADALEAKGHKQTYFVKGSAAELRRSDDPPSA